MPEFTQIDHSLNPRREIERAIRLLLELVEALESEPVEAEASELAAALVERGVEPRLAERVCWFTPIAFGRELLGGLGVTFSDAFLRLDAFGEASESGRLSREPVFQVAARLARRGGGSAAFRALATASSEYQAVSEALRRGEDPRDVVVGPVAMFDHPPDPEAMRRAEALLASMTRAPSEPRGKSSWWEP